MHLTPPTNQYLHTLLGWFDTNDSVSVWGGPDMRVPMTFDSLKVDAKIDDLNSYFLIDHDGNTVGFGQFYRRLNHCHLGRLVIAPEYRGQRRGELLIEALSTEGARLLMLESQSLFVLADNRPARTLYERLGFRETPYPGDDVHDSNIVYLIRQ